MTSGVADISGGTVVQRLTSPAFTMTYPEVWHADRIPPEMLSAMEHSWKRTPFPSREVTISLLEDVIVASEGLVFTSTLDLLQSSIAGHSGDEIENARLAIVAGMESGNIAHFDGTVVLCKKRGARVYGHWMMEMLPKAFFVRRHWPDRVRYMVHATPDPLGEVVRTSLSRLGIGQGELIEVGDGPVRVDRLLMVEGLTVHGSYMSPLVMECIDAISADIPPESAKHLFVLRGGLPSRRFVDEDEVHTFAKRRGYSVVDPASMPFVRQVACFKAARRIVGVMGSAMTNIAFAQPGAEVFNFAPANMSDTFFWFIAGLRGLRYVEVRCAQVPPARGPMPWDTDLLLSPEDRELIFGSTAMEVATSTIGVGWNAEAEQRCHDERAGIDAGRLVEFGFETDAATVSKVVRQNDLTTSDGGYFDGRCADGLGGEMCHSNPHQEGPAMAETTLPDLKGLSYLNFLSAVHETFAPQAYLEIGTRSGDSLKLANCASIAIDPHFLITSDVIGQKPMCLMFQGTSDEYFAKQDLRSLFSGCVDFAFLDGLHLFEVLLRDFLNTERLCCSNSMIAIHDCIPTDVYIAERNDDPERRGEMGSKPSWWTGDVWKIVPILKKWRPDLTLISLDCIPTGLLLVTNLDPESRVLTNDYENIVAQFAGTDLATYGLERFHAEAGVKSAALMRLPIQPWTSKLSSVKNVDQAT